MRIAAPSDGVVMNATMATSRRGPHLLRVTRTRRLWATFAFARGTVPAKSGSQLAGRAYSTPPAWITSPCSFQLPSSKRMIWAAWIG